MPATARGKARNDCGAAIRSVPRWDELVDSVLSGAKVVSRNGIPVVQFLRAAAHSFAREPRTLNSVSLLAECVGQRLMIHNVRREDNRVVRAEYRKDDVAK